MPTQSDIKKMAKQRHISVDELSKQVFGHMRKHGWRPQSQGGPTKAWTKNKR